MTDYISDTMKTRDEQRQEKLSTRGKKWNRHSLVFFGCAVIWLLLLEFTDMEPIIGPLGSIVLLMLTMAAAVVSLILSAFFTWHARTLRKEIEYYSTDPSIEKEEGKDDQSGT